jgi:hypothetical protein
MAYSREPDYFRAVGLLGRDAQVAVADKSGEIVGVGCREVNELYVDGEKASVGYLSGLRLRDDVRNGTLLARGYAFLRKLHNDCRTKFYLTTIVSGNSRAIETLTAKRANLPSYVFIGDYVVHIVPVKRKSARVPSEGEFDIQTGERVPPDEILNFLNREGRRRQFFPVNDREKVGVFRHIDKKDMYIAMKDGEMVGFLAVWNQEDMKQHTVSGYSTVMKIGLPLINTGLKSGGFYALPGVGERFRSAAISLVCFRDDNAAAFRATLRYAMNRIAGSGVHQVGVGMFAADPLRRGMRGIFHMAYRSKVFLVCWEDGVSFCNSTKRKKVPYLELAVL